MICHLPPFEITSPSSSLLSGVHQGPKFLRQPFLGCYRNCYCRFTSPPLDACQRLQWAGVAKTDQYLAWVPQIQRPFPPPFPAWGKGRHQLTQSHRTCLVAPVIRSEPSRLRLMLQNGAESLLKFAVRKLIQSIVICNHALNRLSLCNTYINENVSPPLMHQRSNNYWLTLP